MHRVVYTLVGMALALPIPIGIAWIADRVDRNRAGEVAVRIERGIPGIRTRVSRKAGEYPVIAMIDGRTPHPGRLEASLDQDGMLVLSYLDADGCLVQIAGSLTAAELIGVLRDRPTVKGTRYPSRRTCTPAPTRTS